MDVNKKVAPCKACSGKGSITVTRKGQKQERICPYCNGTKQQGLRTKEVTA